MRSECVLGCITTTTVRAQYKWITLFGMTRERKREREKKIEHRIRGVGWIPTKAQIPKSPNRIQRSWAKAKQNEKKKNPNDLKMK